MTLRRNYRMKSRGTNRHHKNGIIYPLYYSLIKLTGRAVGAQGGIYTNELVPEGRRNFHCLAMNTDHRDFSILLGTSIKFVLNLHSTAYTHYPPIFTLHFIVWCPFQLAFHRIYPTLCLPTLRGITSVSIYNY